MNRYYLVENGEEEDITDLIRDFRDIVGGCLGLESSIEFEELVKKIVADPEYDEPTFPEYDEPTLGFLEKKQLNLIIKKVRQRITQTRKIVDLGYLSSCMGDNDISLGSEILLGTSIKGVMIWGGSDAVEDDRLEENTRSDKMLNLVYDSDKVNEGTIGLGGRFFNRLIDTLDARGSLELISDERDPLIQRKVMALCFWNKIKPALITEGYDKGVVIDSANVKIEGPLLERGYYNVFISLELNTGKESMTEIARYVDFVDCLLFEETEEAKRFVKEVEKDYKKRLEKKN